MKLARFVGLFAASVASACAGDLEEHLPQVLEGTATSPSSAGNVAPTTTHFDSDIQRDIDALTCSTTGCHGSNQGGLLLIKGATGADLTANFEAFKARAEAGELSKVLVKPTGGDGHVGGAKFAKDDPIYARWRTWIDEGHPR